MSEVIDAFHLTGLSSEAQGARNEILAGRDGRPGTMY